MRLASIWASSILTHALSLFPNIVCIGSCRNNGLGINRFVRLRSILEKKGKWGFLPAFLIQSATHVSFWFWDFLPRASHKETHLFSWSSQINRWGIWPVWGFKSQNVYGRWGRNCFLGVVVRGTTSNVAENLSWFWTELWEQWLQEVVNFPGLYEERILREFIILTLAVEE